QLRFNDLEELIFGMNINHYVPNTNEDSYWIHVPKEKVGWASRFGELQNIKGIKPSRRVEFLPYFASSSIYRESFDAANPFLSEFETDYRIGGDVKLGLGPNLTPDATINPDFGQVDADPATV